MKKWQIPVLILVAILSFMAGQRFQQFNYDDICLDMGGGRNPNGYPICVIEKLNDS
jgi:hypothetical protein